MRIRFSADGPDPFPGPVPALDGPEIELSEAELDAIAGESVVCEIASLRTDLAAEDGPVLAALPEVRVPATFRKNLGARRVVSIGEVDGRSLPEPLRMNCPAVAVAYEVEDAEQARGDQDALVRSALAGIRRRLESDPETAGAGEGLGPANHENREVSLTSAVERFAGRNPWYSAMGLAWGTVDGPTSRWQVYASHPEWRDRVERRIGALESDSAAAGRTAFVSIGRFDGERLARHLEGWLGERNRFDGVCEVFWQEISVCSRLAHHVPELRWKASRRGEAILVEIDARLVKP
jgi:hypothetical protein